MKNKGNIRIKDIARMAGVSIGTVDRVLHNRGKVSKEVHDKIIQVIEETGYQPNLLARTLSTQKTITIAVLIPDPALDEFWEFTNTGVNDAVEEWAQYNVEIKRYYYNQNELNSFETVSMEMLKADPDAVLTSPILHHESLEFFIKSDKEFPFIFFNSNIPEVDPICIIGQDFYQSGRLGAELLDLTTNKKGTFAIFHIFEDLHNSIHLEQKQEGFFDYFKDKKDPAVKALSVNLGVPDGKQFENKLNEVLSSNDIRGILVTASKGLPVIASYLEKHKKKGIRLIGYDPLRENVEYLNKGLVNFLIYQNPRKQASLGITHLVNHVLYKKEIPKIELLPLEIITEQNLSTFMINVNA